MIQLHNLIFSDLPNEAHYRFFGKATQRIAAAGEEVKEIIDKLIPELNKWYVIETENIEWQSRSDLTPVIAVADNKLNRKMTALSALLNEKHYSDLPSESEAADRLHKMIKGYGKIASKPYLQKIGAVKAILIHLKGDYHNDIVAVGAATNVTEIEAALNEFTAYVEERQQQSLQKPASSFSVTRHEIEKVWRAIVKKVNAGAELDFTDQFERFINTLNPEIDELNKEFHRVRHNIALSEPAPIARQQYTGYPCTPAVEVLIVTSNGTVKLELGKDYNVVYTNNVEVGNATCTIYGKGHYRGKKAVTFIIAR
jgi:hypothetical protein